MPSFVGSFMDVRSISAGNGSGLCGQESQHQLIYEHPSLVSPGLIPDDSLYVFQLLWMS